MTQRPPLRSATPRYPALPEPPTPAAAGVPTSGPAVVPRTLPAQRPAPRREYLPKHAIDPSRPGPALLGGPSILTGRSILGHPSIITAGPSAPSARAAESTAPTRIWRWTTPPRVVGRAARRGGRAVGAWSRRPSGRFVVPLFVVLLVLAATATGGNLAVRAAGPAARASAPVPSAASSAPDDTTESPPTDPDNAPIASGATSSATGQAGRPPDVVAGWAKRMAPAVGISAVALEAYGYAALRMTADQPTCHLAWTTLAAIGKVESDHGTAQHATLGPDGIALPPIIGPALDGQGGRQLVLDTDTGRYDGDRVYDHAVGPMQFIPHTWQQYQADADQDGQADPNDLNDAALAAGKYLCAGGKDLATSGGWWGAIETYNQPMQYSQDVFAAADDYGRRSRAVA